MKLLRQIEAFQEFCISWIAAQPDPVSVGVETKQFPIPRFECRIEILTEGRINRSFVSWARYTHPGHLRQSSRRFISMSRPGTPYDNTKAERFMRTLKYEEVYLNDYDNFAEVLRSMKHFIEAVYIHKRLHSATGYLPPAEN